MDYKSAIAALLAEATGLDADTLAPAIEVPKDDTLGDFAFPCFRLAKELRKAPPAIAAELADKLPKADFLDICKNMGPYLNFFISKAHFAKTVLSAAAAAGADWGAQESNADKTVVVEFSSPNLAKQLHIGHMYTTVLGNSLYKIFQKLGYNTYAVNYPGDWGAQYGKMLAAYKLWGSKEAIDADGVMETDRLYVRFHAEAEKDPSLNDVARSWLVKMENGDEEALALWGWFRDISMKDIKRLYERLNIHFDLYRGESYYTDKMPAVAEELREKNLLIESDGAMIVDLEAHKMPPCLILRSDGGTLYPTRDIATALDRWSDFHFHKSIYVTDMRQSLHFAQFFKVVELMGYEWAQDMVHVPYGLLSLEGEALSSRKGNVLLLQELFDKAAAGILDIINDKNPELPNKEAVAEQVGIGATIFSALYNSRIKDTDIQWSKILSFEGETGPYVQYTHARCTGVLDKANEDFSGADLTLLDDELSFAICKLVYEFPARLQESAEKLEPFIISRHLMDLAQAFNRFYHDNPILTSPDGLRQARLYLVSVVKNVLCGGLALLGIASPEKM